MAQDEVGEEQMAGLERPMQTHAPVDRPVVVDHAARAELHRRALRTLVDEQFAAALANQRQRVVQYKRKDPFLALDRQKLGRSAGRSEEHTSELQSLMRISYAVFCLKKNNKEKEINILNC